MLTPATFKKAWQNLAIPDETPLFLAISGGVDSMVMLDLLRPFLPHHALTLLHVNYQLRAEAAAETAYLEKFAETHDLPFFVKYYEEAGPFSEEAGRKFRYAFFAEKMQPGSVLLTAHHLDDLAETFLLKVTRGTRLEKLGFPARRPFANGQLVRPLLSFSKAEIYQYAQYHDLTYFEDATNASRDYARNRYRLDVVPALKKENPQVLLSLKHLNEELVALQEKKSTALGATVTPGPLNLTSATTEHILQWFTLNDLVAPPRQLEQVVTWVKKREPQTDTIPFLNGQLKKQAGHLFWQENPPELQAEQQTPAVSQVSVPLILNQWVDLDSHEKIGLFAATVSVPLPEFAQLTTIPLYQAPHFPLICRHAEPGDTLALQKSGYTKKVTRYFIDQKIVKNLRPKVWLVTDSLKNVLWIVPDGKSYLSSKLETDKMLYRLIYLKN